jgi:hypothetical protein
MEKSNGKLLNKLNKNVNFDDLILKPEIQKATIECEFAHPTEGKLASAN